MMPAKRTGLKTINVDEDIFNYFYEQYKREKENARLLGEPGPKSFVRFMTDKLRELKKLEEKRKPRFEHFNVYEDHVTIRDNEAKRLIDVYVRNQGIRKILWCEFCKSQECVHVGYAWSLPYIQKVLADS
ncbi:MAG: hypothetical protein NZ896_03610 [Nitrososphaerales archaeon]|nr:hypothetical protein [Nitrososphaerales archaeon]